MGSRSRRPARRRERGDVYRTRPPGPLYCDASALVKLYVSEPGSDEFNRSVEGRLDLLVSDLAVTEVVSAIARRQREREGTADVAGRVQHAILDALQGRVYQRVELTADVHRRAEHLLLTRPDTPLRAADALHLALAMSARAASIASFDVRLGAAARAVGIAAYPD